MSFGVRSEVRIGLETVLVNLPGDNPAPSVPAMVDLLELESFGKNGLIGDLDTVIGVACCKVADRSSSMKPSLSVMLITDCRLSNSGAWRLV